MGKFCKKYKTELIYTSAFLLIVIAFFVYKSFLNSQNFENERGELTNTCTLSVKCDTILSHAEALNPDKKDLIPQDGVIFLEQEVGFSNGETAMDLLEYELKKKKIDIDVKTSSFADSKYISGIGGICEGDCGTYSGWVYKVNGEMPNVAISEYKLSEGDKVEFLFSCDMGNDV